MFPQFNLAFHNRLLPQEIKEMMLEVEALDIGQRINKAMQRFFEFVASAMQGIHGTSSAVSLSYVNGVLNAQFVIVNPLSGDVFFLAQLGRGTFEAYEQFTREFAQRHFKDVFRSVSPLSTRVLKTVPYASVRESLYDYMLDLSQDQLFSFFVQGNSNYMHVSDNTDGVLKVTRLYPASGDDKAFNVTVQTIMIVEKTMTFDKDTEMSPQLLQTMHEARTALAN